MRIAEVQAQSRQNLCCSLTYAVGQEETSTKELDVSLLRGRAYALKDWFHVKHEEPFSRDMLFRYLKLSQLEIYLMPQWNSYGRDHFEHMHTPIRPSVPYKAYFKFKCLCKSRMRSWSDYIHAHVNLVVTVRRWTNVPLFQIGLQFVPDIIGICAYKSNILI